MANGPQKPAGGCRADSRLLAVLSKHLVSETSSSYWRHAAGISLAIAAILDTTASIFFLYVSPTNGAEYDSSKRLTCTRAVGLLVLSSAAGLIAFVTLVWLLRCTTPGTDQQGKLRRGARWCSIAFAFVVLVSNALSVGAAVWLSIARGHNDLCSSTRVQSMVVFPTLASAVVAAVVSCF